MQRVIGIFLRLFVASMTLTATAHADEAGDWNRIMVAALAAENVGGIVATRHAAIVQSAVYDSVNGIERRYRPIHVAPAAPRGASSRAAAVQAAYATLLKLLPAQKDSLDAKRTAALGAISPRGEEGNRSVEDGVRWGQTVADAIWAWRSKDGFTTTLPPNVGGTAVGQWRPTVAGASFGGLQFASMTPWVIQSSSQFSLPGPPALASARYATDFNEVKAMGSASSGRRTPDQTVLARFWANSPTYVWNPVAISLSVQRQMSLVETARVLAMMNVAMADAGIAVWHGKLSRNFWRPITAVQLAETDGNAATAADPDWVPLIPTPPYPDYPSGIVGVASAAATVLASVFGSTVALAIESSTAPGVTRSFADFGAAVDEIVDARVFGGIHFRFADTDARQLGTSVGNYVVANSFGAL
jgi:hypothetical protein